MAAHTVAGVRMEELQLQIETLKHSEEAAEKAQRAAAERKERRRLQTSLNLGETPTYTRPTSETMWEATIPAWLLAEFQQSSSQRTKRSSGTYQAKNPWLLEEALGLLSAQYKNWWQIVEHFYERLLGLFLSVQRRVC